MLFNLEKTPFGTLWSSAEKPEYGKYFEPDGDAMLSTVTVERKTLEDNEFIPPGSNVGASITVKSEALIKWALELDLFFARDQLIDENDLEADIQPLLTLTSVSLYR